jgi:hypothetical protein
MDATLYTQNGTSTNVVVNAGQFKPDLVWLKCRSNAGTFNVLTDTVRGIANSLYSNSTNLENGDGNNFFNSFNSNGFSLTLGDSGTNSTSGRTQVGWQWQAGQGTNTTNTSGSITSTVSVNTTAGFSIVTYTGTGANATVGHGLGVAPRMVIIKNRTAGSTAWNVYQASIPSGNLLSLNSTAASFANTNRITAVSSTTFSIGTDSDVNGSTNSHVAYCWADVSGFSRAFNYTGNGNADGVFTYLGFLPKFVLIKRTDTTGDWYMWDTARNTFDVITNTLLANSSAAETSATSIDALSNGFKLRNTTAGFNASGGTYIGMAWASSPFKNSNAF